MTGRRLPRAHRAPAPEPGPRLARRADRAVRASGTRPWLGGRDADRGGGTLVDLRDRSGSAVSLLEPPGEAP